MSTAAQRDIGFVAGDGYRHKFEFQQKDPDNPGSLIALDVSDLIFEASVRPWWDSEVHEDFTLDNVASDFAGGIVWMYLTSVQTANAAFPYRSVWDAQFHTTGNDPTTFVRGNCLIDPEATS